MPSVINPLELLNAHVQVQLGTFLSRVDSLGYEMHFASSDRISDYYWNFGYGLNATLPELPDAVAQLRRFAQSLEREPILYYIPDATGELSRIPEILGAESLGDETWMVFSGDNPQVDMPSLRISVVSSAEDLQSFLGVFNDAYGSGSPDEPGYSGLPEEYPSAIQSAAPKDAVVTHLIGRDASNTPVCIASLHAKGSYAGLYSVGTAHRERRRGYGAAISAYATSYALSQGYSIVFLQTEADSIVEEMYANLGFERQFIGKFLRLP